MRTIYWIFPVACVLLPHAPAPAAEDADKIDSNAVIESKDGSADESWDGHRGETLKRLIRHLPPETLERLKKLRQDNPEEFRNEVRRLSRMKGAIVQFSFNGGH